MTAPLATTSYGTLGLLALRQHSASEVASGALLGALVTLLLFQAFG